ncbi:MAG: hypothetical protein JXA30_13290 [Deltaproteobacteria bacterium]|nr:hypothetical protein [Deltaproteobacteria bacterium]
MKINRRRLPSIGFIALLLTYGLAAAFFLWGFSQPDLDRVWYLHHELKIGRTYQIKKRDKKILLRAMARHRELARALLPSGEIGIVSENSDGWIATPVVTIIRTPESGAKNRLLFDIRTSKSLLPYSITIRGSDFDEKIAIHKQGKIGFDLPRVGATAEIITLRLEGRDFIADPSVLGVRIRFAHGG